MNIFSTALSTSNLLWERCDFVDIDLERNVKWKNYHEREPLYHREGGELQVFDSKALAR